MTWLVPIAGWLVLTVSLTVSGLFAWQLIAHLRFVQYHRYKRLRLPPLSFTRFCALHAGEVWAWVVLGWWMLWARFRDGLREPANPTGPNVLCVHGFSQNGTNFWGIRCALLAAGRGSRSVFMGRLGRPLRGYTEPLRQALSELPGPVDVVCHSMGGVILRLVLVDNPELANRIRCIVTLGSPHRGTAAPRGLALLPDVRELSRGSAVLKTLPMLNQLAPAAAVTAIATQRDFIVYPSESALPAGCEQVLVTGIGHAGLLVYRRSVDVIVNALTRSTARQAAS